MLLKILRKFNFSQHIHHKKVACHVILVVMCTLHSLVQWINTIKSNIQSGKFIACLQFMASFKKCKYHTHVLTVQMYFLIE